MQSANAPYIARLDHLRAVAALMVFLFHVRLYTMTALPSSILSKIPVIEQGHAGVALFMVVSGFILAHIAGDAEIDVPKFFLNRALRIYPLFIVVVALGYFATPDPRQVSAGADFLMALLPISNLYRLHYGLYGGALWSIAVELQFYLIFPILYKQLRSSGWLGFAAILSLLIALRCIVYLTTGTVHQLAYFSIFGGLDAFVFGFIAHAVYDKLNGRFLSAWSPVIVCALILGLLDIAFRYPGFFHVDYNKVGTDGISKSALWIVWPPIQAFAFAALVVTYLRASRLDYGKRLSGGLAWLGKISYSLYIWHIAIIQIVLPRVQGAAGVWLYAGGLFLVIVTVLFAAASYYIIERPFLKYRVYYLKS